MAIPRFVYFVVVVGEVKVAILVSIVKVALIRCDVMMEDC